MAKAKKVEMLNLEQLVEFLADKGVQAFKVNDSTIKLPYVFGSELELPMTDVTVLNSKHVPIKLKAKA